MNVLDFTNRTPHTDSLTTSSDVSLEPYTSWGGIDVEIDHTVPGALNALRDHTVACLRIHNVLHAGTAKAIAQNQEDAEALSAKIRMAVEAALSINIEGQSSMPVITGLHGFPSGLRIDCAVRNRKKHGTQLTIVANLGPATCRAIRIYRQPWRASDFVWRIPGGDGVFDRRLVAGAASYSWALAPGAVHVVSSSLPYEIEASEPPPATLTIGMAITLRAPNRAFDLAS